MLRKCYQPLLAAKRRFSNGRSSRPKSSIGNFELKDQVKFSDFEMEMFQFEHSSLGTQVYHFDCEDKNNAFAFLFRTLPEDEKGKPNILERMIACGSQEFPVRKLFFNMSLRSRNKFGNSMTGHDVTLFPFSSNNAQDFENLLKVYTDAVFFPKLDRLDFLNEGVMKEVHNDRIFARGKAYYEMKNKLQSQDDFVAEKTVRLLMKETEYKFSSGGDPVEMLSLTHEELVDFHAKRYNPSNSVFLSYGCFDYKKHLELLENNCLTHFKRNDLHLTPTPPKPLSSEENFIISMSCPPSNENVRSSFSSQLVVAYNLGELNAFENFAMSIVNSLLFEFPDSPLFQRFIESERCGGYCSGKGLEATYLRYPIFVLGLRGVSNDLIKTEKMSREIKQILTEVAEEGFDEKLVNSCLHMIELGYKKGERNFGTKMFENLVTAFNYNDSELLKTYLHLSETMQLLRKKIKQGYLQELIKKYLVDNKNCITIHFKPDPDFTKNYDEKIQNVLDSEASNLTVEQKMNLEADSEAVRAREEEVNNPECLPKLNLCDLDFLPQVIELEERKIDDVPVYFIDSKSKGLTQLTLKVNLANFPSLKQNQLFVLTRLFTSIGVSGMNAKNFSVAVNNKSGGFIVDQLDFCPLNSVTNTEKILTFTFCALDQNIEEIFNLFSRILREPDFSDFEQISNAVKIQGAECIYELIKNPQEFSKSLAEEGISFSSKTSDAYKSTKYCAELSVALQTNAVPANVIKRSSESLLELWRQCFKKENISFLINSSKKNDKDISKRIRIMISEFATNSWFNSKSNFPKIEREEPLVPKKDFYIVPTDRNFISESFSIPCFDHKDYPALIVAARFLSLGPMKNIMEERYDAADINCSASSNGAFTFTVSQRDKHLESFLGFEETLDSVLTSKLEDEELEKAKLSIIEEQDQIQLSEEQGLPQFLYQLTEEKKKKLKENILSVSSKDVLRVLDDYIYKNILEDKSSKVILGNSENNMEGLVERGWKVVAFADGLSLDPSDYHQREYSED